MDIIQELLQGITMPKMVKISQSFPSSVITNITETLRQEMSKPAVSEKITPGKHIAIAVGSRGIAEIVTLVRVTVEELKKRGAIPFIIPAMGSHGGATAVGQLEVLSNLGITEATAGCPIKSSMTVVKIGSLPNSLPVYMDEYALAADGIVVINRIKPHTAFRGACESGMVKMLTIGLGKQKGAESCHAYGFKYMAENILAMASMILKQTPVLFGIGTVENAYDQITTIVAAPAEKLIEIDQQLQIAAKFNMASIMFDQIDVLVIDRIGKDISGDGMDPNITGRYPTSYASGGPQVSKMVVLDLTVGTHGNANGMGTADFTTRRLVNKTDFNVTYANGLTSTVVGPTHIPTVLNNDFDAIRAAVKTSNAHDLGNLRLIRIKDTLHLGEIYISQAMLKEAQTQSNITILSEPMEMQFDSQGNLLD